jgi:hypothetical protein
MTANANLPAYSSLERVIQQSTVVRQYLQQEVGKVTNHAFVSLTINYYYNNNNNNIKAFFPRKLE